MERPTNMQLAVGFTALAVLLILSGINYPQGVSAKTFFALGLDMVCAAFAWALVIKERKQ